MRIETLCLAKKTGTYADAIAAFGLGHLLYLLAGEHPHLEDAGSYYAVSFPSGWHESSTFAYESVRAAPGYDYVVFEPGDHDAPTGDRIDYAQQRERLLASRKMCKDLKKLRKGTLTAEDREQIRAAEPMPNWMLYQALRVLQALGSYNALHLAIRRADPESFAAAVEAKLWGLTARPDPPTPSATFEPKVSAVQALNPTVGKGTNRPKPDGPALSGLPSSYVDWFEEWLRFIGIGRAARAVNIGDDIKLVALAPANMDEAAIGIVHEALVHEALVHECPWTSAKSDLLAALRLARTLVAHSGLLQVDEPDVAAFFADPDSTPRDVIAGLHTAYFKSLGSARALTNVGFIGLPGWFPVTTETAGEWIEILDEHRCVLAVLKEEKSEEAILLFLYRDFLSAGEQDVGALLGFLGAYAVHVMRAHAKGQFVRQFTVSYLRRLLRHMSESYEAIVSNEGFRSVATAMRQATVTEQYSKSQRNQQYEIHYGLFADIKRKAQFRDQLVVAISAFLTAYNAENARVQERAATGVRRDVRHRPRVTTQQLDDLVRLLDNHNPEVVAMLLLAYASARDPRESDPATLPAGDTGLEVEVDEEGVEE